MILPRFVTLYILHTIASNARPSVITTDNTLTYLEASVCCALPNVLDEITGMTQMSYSPLFIAERDIQFNQT